MKIFHCAVCGKAKILTRSDMQYCSERCRKKAFYQRHKPKAGKFCAYCSEAFIPRRSDQRCCKPSHRVALCRQLKKLESA